MTKNPIINAGTALAYIILVSIVMFFGSQNLPKKDTVFAPIAVLSLFTLSAAVMTYVFCYEPLLLLLGGKKKAAVELFLKTLAIFGAATFIILILNFSRILK